MEAKPIFITDNLAYERPEKDGYYTFVPKHHPETMELIINSTGKQILDLCDGSRTVNQIIGEMSARYSKVALRTLERDVSKTLSKYSRLAIVEWDGENPFLFRREEPAGHGRVMSIAQDFEILPLKTFIQSISSPQSEGVVNAESFAFSSPLCHANDYTELALRQRLFSYAEEFFLLREGGEIVGMISITTPLLQDSVGHLKIVACPQDSFGEFISYSRDAFLYLTIKPVTKLRLTETAIRPLTDEFRKALGKNGFKDEGSFEHEMGFGGAVHLLSYFYAPAFVAHVEQMKTRD